MTTDETTGGPGYGSAYERFRALHHAERPLVLPNAWDHASGAALHRRGFAAIGTTSLGVAAAAGLPDGTGATRAQTLELARGLARLPVPVTADVEGGFSDDPDEVAALARELAEAGVAGVNLEDGRPDGTLTEPARHAEKVRAAKEAAPALFVNARTDTHWTGADPTVRAALRRCAVYVAAGADGVFVPGVTAEDDVAALAAEAGAPLNVLYAPGTLPVDRLAELGVSRVSTGSLLFRAALARAVEAAAALTEPGGAAPPPDYGYGDVQDLAGAFRL